MELNFDYEIIIGMEQYFYVGDAAGRINDHSDVNICFSKDVGLNFPSSDGCL
jgi:bifunctional polynucleotide phosphatase/kinase